MLEKAGLKLDAEFDAWAMRLDALVAGGAPEDRLRFRAGFGRSFNYYDGFLFEVRSPAFADDAPVARWRAIRRPARPAGRRGFQLSRRLRGVRPGRAWVGAEGPG